MTTATSQDRQDLLDKKERLESELAEVNRVLDAMDVVEKYRASQDGQVQPALPLTGEYADLGPTALVRAILASDKEKWWGLDDLLNASKQGGWDWNRYLNPKNNLGVSAYRLAERDAIQHRKRRGKVQYRHAPSDSEQ
ncbi:hypothetical protein LCGC14_1668360 [marine sediment metagenome]|uniref:Uncharacterized protein n=1 Tax=marine sediment metagenome TaxID=412755 RepID=A0A0F9K7W5_9ZZZZ